MATALLQSISQTRKMLVRTFWVNGHGLAYRTSALRSKTTTHGSSTRYAWFKSRHPQLAADDWYNGEGGENGRRRRPTLFGGAGLVSMFLLGEMMGADIRCAPAPVDSAPPELPEQPSASWFGWVAGNTSANSTDDAANGSIPPPVSAAPSSNAGGPSNPGEGGNDAAALIDAMNWEEFGVQVRCCFRERPRSTGLLYLYPVGIQLSV